MDAEFEGVPVSATDNYTPTDWDIRQAIAGIWFYRVIPMNFDEALILADRWLAAERAKAWDESMTTADIWYQERLAGIPPTGRYPANPYREVQ